MLPWKYLKPEPWNSTVEWKGDSREQRDFALTEDYRNYVSVGSHVPLGHRAATIGPVQYRLTKTAIKTKRSKAKPEGVLYRWCVTYWYEGQIVFDAYSHGALDLRRFDSTDPREPEEIDQLIEEHFREKFPYLALALLATEEARESGDKKTRKNPEPVGLLIWTEYKHPRPSLNDVVEAIFRTTYGKTSTPGRQIYVGSLKSNLMPNGYRYMIDCFYIGPPTPTAELISDNMLYITYRDTGPHSSETLSKGGHEYARQEEEARQLAEDDARARYPLLALAALAKEEGRRDS